jgi:hypothetical protein
MTPIYAFFISLLLFVNNTPTSKQTVRVYATCYGYFPCSACTSCNYCAHCNAGRGTCGVCKDLKKEKSSAETKSKDNTKPSTKPSTTATAIKQCKATTKKGTRCSRNERSNGYCWQHGG